MSRDVPTGLVLGLVVAVAVSIVGLTPSLAAGATSAVASRAPSSPAPGGPGPSATASEGPAAPVRPAVGSPAPRTPAERQFEQHVLATARNLSAAGVASDRYSLPNIGPPAHLSNGVVVPGVLATGASSPFPTGVAYYGESDPSGTLLATDVNASSVVGSLTVNTLDSTYLEDNSPNVTGVQLNSMLNDVTLQGTTGYQFWTQNALDYFAENATLQFGEDTWNFSGGSIGTDQSTIAAHSPNGSVSGGIYVGEGPYLPAPTPYTLTLYLNSSLTASDDQELWYNYTLAAAGQPFRSGNYDWVVFNSTNPAHPRSVETAPFFASGNSLTTYGIPFDYELDFGIAPYNGATNDVFAGNVSASLAYCPVASTPCTPSEVETVPAAVDYGSQTGETGSGLAFTFDGSTAHATAGPSLPLGLWGYSGAAGTAAGAGLVTVSITTSGSPEGAGTSPAAFVFLNDTATGFGYAWAPDVPVWHLMPGAYTYLVMLADYTAQVGRFTLTAAGTSFAVVLPYSVSSGVYTPLWAFDNGELAALSTSGTGTLASQYQLFHNPTSNCTGCDGATDGNLSSWFLDYNDYLYPTFPGVLLEGTSAYVELTRPVTFTVFAEIASADPETFDLPLEFDGTSHVTLADAAGIGTWPAMFAILMQEATPAAQNPFPQANVIVWDSTSDLIAGNRFTTEPSVGYCTSGPCYPIECYGGCVPADELLLYGGRNNTVWGNTFRDPPNATLETGGAATYAGLAEAESGDLLYNNNFSVDNPTMLMAYDLFNDSCWAGYAGQCLPLIEPSYVDRWNVSNQSAAEVAETVNGLPLSGNVLGPDYRLQGGNYWWNWGDAENPYSVLPYTNVFDYTQNATNLPPGYPAVESSLRVGGDAVPLRWGYFGPPPVHVTFEESGLPNGTPWSVTFGTTTLSSASSSVVFSEEAGDYAYSFGPVPGYETPSPGHLVVGSVAITVPAAFAAIPPPVYAVTFTESGLAAGTDWTVTFAGSSSVPGTGPIVFLTPNGTYPFSVGSPGPAAYVATPANGTVTVAGANQTVAISFVGPPAPPPPAATYPVTFQESGLPAGVNWSVTLNGTLAWSVGTEVQFPSLINGTYGFSVPSAQGYLPNATTGRLTVDGSPVNWSLSFRAPPPSSAAPSTGGWTPLDVGLLVVGLVAVAAAVAAVVWVGRRRRGRTGTPPAGEPPRPDGKI